MNNAEKIGYKMKLRQAGLDLLQARMDTAKEAMQRAQEALEGEEKSSMGDKYETSRAMGHIEKDLHARNYENVRQQRASLLSISCDTIKSDCLPGALIECDTITCFISAGLGKIELEGHSIHLISSQAPIALAMRGCKPGDTFSFNGKEFRIRTIY